MNKTICTLVGRLVLAVFFLLAVPAGAAEHGGGGPAGPEPMQFTVNIGRSAAEMRVLQLTMVFEFADPEMAKHFAEFKPKIQHRMILLLSSEELAVLQTSKGKLELQEKIVGDVNKLLHATTKDGVKEVFFTSFIIAS